MVSRFHQYLCLATLLLLPSSLLLAQGNLGGLNGSVVDSSGAAVPGARITLKSQANNQVITTESTDAGFVFRGVSPGVYQMEVEKTGFKKVVRESLNILTATQAEISVTLEVGNTADAVTVASSSIALQTSSPEVSTVLQRQTLLDLPIQVGSGASTTAASGRRQPETFIFLTPGVVGTQWGKSINGSPEFGQEVLVDGISAQLASNPGFLGQTSPPYEAVEEFKVQNTLFPAEFGRGFGVINYTLRSGTNTFHGGLFEFIRNDKLDARPFFNRTRPIVRFNEYGGNLGGPVIIPKLYNGKDRTFFNFNYTGLRNSPPLPGNLVSMPTPEFLRGDFSRHVDSNGALLPIFDPATTLADGTRTPFPGNVIPAGRFSRVARNTTPLLPAPDLPGYFNNFLARNANPVEDDIWSLKADHLLSSRQRVSYVMWRSLNDQFVNSVLGRANGPLGPWFLSTTKGSNYRANYDLTVTPTVLFHFGYGYTKSNPTRVRDERKGNETIQLPGIPRDNPGFPTFNINNTYGGLEIGNSAQQPNDPSANISHAWVGSLSWVKGRHQFKFGGEGRLMKFVNFAGTQNGGLSGAYTFSNLSTSSLTDPRFNQLGNGWASFLLGDVFSGTRFFPMGERTVQNEFYAYYVDDVWRVNNKLTVTLGFRHEVPTTVRDTEGRQSGFDPALANPGAAGRPGALRFFGDRIVPNYYGQLSPRVGLAYTVNPKTVIRSGFGIFYSPGNATQIGQFPGRYNAGFTFPQAFPNTSNGRVAAFNLDQGVPAFTGTLPNKDAALLNGATIDYMNPSANKAGYTNSWTFNIQRELPGSFLLDMGYVGSRSLRLPSGLENINQVDISNLRLGNTLNSDVASAAAVAAGITRPYPGFTGSVAQALRPFPQYTGINNLAQPTGFSNYHALQTRLQRRYSNGLSLLFSYTLSKTLVHGAGYSNREIDAAGGAPLDTRNRDLEKRLAPFDRKHNAIVSWTYELPFGSKRKFLSNAPRALDLIAGGWQLNGIHTLRTGAPVFIGGGGAIPLFAGGNRPNILNTKFDTGVTGSDYDPGDPSRQRKLDINAWAQPAAFTLGNAAPSYNLLRGFGSVSEDFSIQKNFRLFESHQLQFRTELFNAFNRVNWGGPAANINAPANFGRITSTDPPRSIQLALKYMF
jgi:hypothetical protein